jgi:hypothetical protein
MLHAFSLHSPAYVGGRLRLPADGVAFSYDLSESQGLLEQGHEDVSVDFDLKPVPPREETPSPEPDPAPGAEAAPESKPSRSSRAKPQE